MYTKKTTPAEKPNGDVMSKFKQAAIQEKQQATIKGGTDNSTPPEDIINEDTIDE